MYQTTANIPKAGTSVLLIGQRAARPAKRREQEKRSAEAGGILPEGSGLFLVLGIRASISLS